MLLKGHNKEKSYKQINKCVDWLKKEFDNNYLSTGYISSPKTLNIIVNGAFEHKNKCPTCYTRELEIVDVHEGTRVRVSHITHQDVLDLIIRLSWYYFIELEYRYEKEII